MENNKTPLYLKVMLVLGYLFYIINISFVLLSFLFLVLGIVYPFFYLMFIVFLHYLNTKMALIYKNDKFISFILAIWPIILGIRLTYYCYYEFSLV